MTDNTVSVRLPENALLSYAEVLNWIAFRQACEDNLVGACDSGVLRVLERMSEGLPLWETTPPPPGTPDWAIVNLPSPGVAEDIHRAKALVQREGRSPAEIASEMRRQVDAWLERHEQWRSALNDLTDRVLRQEILTQEAPRQGAYENRKSPSGLLTLMLPDLRNTWFAAERVLELWPAPQAPNRPKISEAALLRFQATYVSTWAGTSRKPNRKQHAQAIKEAFPNHEPVHSRRLTKLRSSPGTPTSWGAPGRHKSNHDGK